MPDTNINTSIAVISQQMGTLAAAIAKVEGAVSEGNKQSSVQNTQIIGDIRVLTTQQEGNAKYQDACDKERKSLREDVTKLKTQTIMGSGILSTMIVCAVEWYRK